MTTFDDLLRQLDGAQTRYATLDAYYEGRQPLSYLSPEAREALGDRLARVSVNVPRLLVNAVAERLRVTGFADVDVSADWLANDLDQTSGMVHRDALVLGSSYVLVWGRGGSPVVTAESAKQCTVLRDPATGSPVAGLKRWSTDTTTEASLFLPDEVVRYRAEVTGATSGGFKVIDRSPNPLGVVPLVPFDNAGRLLAQGCSEMDDVLSLSDALVKLTTDMLVSSEYTARPRRWATGIELEEDEGTGEATNPIPEGDRAMVSENPDAKFGQLAGSDLAGYETAIGTVMRQISAVSGLPEHMLGIGGDNPTSADSIRASEAALTARAEARQRQFGRSWEQVATLMAKVRGVSAAPRVVWADPSTRSAAQEADSVVKLVQAGILPISTALERLGYSEVEIARIRAARRTDALDVAGTDLGALTA